MTARLTSKHASQWTAMVWSMLMNAAKVVVCFMFLIPCTGFWFKEEEFHLLLLFYFCIQIGLSYSWRFIFWENLVLLHRFRIFRAGPLCMRYQFKIKKLKVGLHVLVMHNAFYCVNAYQFWFQCAVDTLRVVVFGEIGT